MLAVRRRAARMDEKGRGGAMRPVPGAYFIRMVSRFIGARVSTLNFL